MSSVNVLSWVSCDATKGSLQTPGGGASAYMLQPVARRHMDRKTSPVNQAFGGEERFLRSYIVPGKNTYSQYPLSSRHLERIRNDQEAAISRILLSDTPISSSFTPDKHVHLDGRECQPVFACYLPLTLAFVSTRGGRKLLPLPRILISTINFN